MMDSHGRGRAAFPSSMNIVDLRQTTVRQIEPLLEVEARHWRDELHWDYRGALELIKRFLDATPWPAASLTKAVLPRGIPFTSSKTKKA